MSNHSTQSEMYLLIELVQGASNDRYNEVGTTYILNPLIEMTRVKSECLSKKKFLVAKFILRFQVSMTKITFCPTGKNSNGKLKVIFFSHRLCLKDN